MRAAPFVLVAWAQVAHAGSLDTLADTLAGQLGQASGDVAVKITGGGGDLAATLEALLRERLGRLPAVRSVGTAVDPDAARAADFTSMATVSLRLEAGRLVAEGVFTPTEHDLWWETARGGRGPRLYATLFAEVPVTADIRARLGTAGTPTRPPGKPVPRRYAFRQLKTPLDLGAPILALSAADLDGDKRHEVIALTTGELVFLDVGDNSLRVRQRFPLEGPAPAPRPRFPIGGLALVDNGDGNAPDVVARSSERASSLRWSATAGVSHAPVDWFPVCAVNGVIGAVRLDRGLPRFRREGSTWFTSEEQPPPRWWATLPDPFLALSCTRIGQETPLAVLDPAGALKVATAAGTSTVPDSGTAFALADLDGDGRPEVIASSSRVRGDGDQLTVWGLPVTGEPRPLHRTAVLKGGVVGVGAGDFDADGVVEALAAVRLVGSTRVDLWVLE